jgi:hypothetical protein
MFIKRGYIYTNLSRFIKGRVLNKIKLKFRF